MGWKIGATDCGRHRKTPVAVTLTTHVISSLTTALRFWETVRWLKPEQVVGRLLFRLARPRNLQSPALPQRMQTGAWIAPSRRRLSLVGAKTFRFLNAERHLPDVGWDNPGIDKLWRYNQHYFDDLNAADAKDRGDWHYALVSEWMAQNPPLRGTGWEPYPTSLRIVNWIKWALAGQTLSPAMMESLAAQVRVLAQRLERHLLGNHLFANAKALIFSGLFLDGEEADNWRSTGFKILDRELAEQILIDGGQFERTPMYHAIALEDVLDLVNVARTYLGTLSEAERNTLARLESAAPKMRAWLAALSHPDGDISFFNDAAFGIAPHHNELEAYADRLTIAANGTSSDLTWLEDSGYVRLEHYNAVLLCDVAPIGPDYLPGHAHADTLSFELSLFGQRVVVNSGTSLYGVSEERLRQRGTPAHSTVTIAGRNSSDVWSGFRVGARARPSAVKVSRRGEHLLAEGAHNGYRSLPGSPTHYRQWDLRPGSLSIHDKVYPGEHPAEARFHLHPDVTATQSGPLEGNFTLEGGERVLWRAEGSPIRIEKSTWHPEFGKTLSSVCLVIPLKNGSSKLELAWS